MIARLAARKMEFSEADRRDTTPPHNDWDRNDESCFPRQGRDRLNRSMIVHLAARKMEFKAERRNTTPPHHYWDRNDEPVSSLGPTPLEHFKPTWQQGNAILQG